MTAAATPVDRGRNGIVDTLALWVRRNTWTPGLLALLALVFAFTKLIQPTYGVSGIQGLAISVLPLALAAVAQAMVVIAGGIDLSIGAMMALTNVVAASQMRGQSEEAAVAIAVGVLVLGIVLGAVNGGLVVLTRVPDIVVTLAMSFVWGGFALIVLSGPGGAASRWLKELGQGYVLNEWIPKPAVVLLVIVALVWIPVRRSRLGLSIYSVGSSQLAAFRSGVSVGRTKVIAYILAGLFAAFGGLALTASTGSGTPLQGGYTLMSIAAVVLGGVNLAGGRGGVVGPIIAVLILALMQTDITFLGVNPNLSTILQGAILIAVVMLGSIAQLRQGRR
jgi:ribose transport system permease protein